MTNPRLITLEGDELGRRSFMKRMAKRTFTKGNLRLAIATAITGPIGPAAMILRRKSKSKPKPQSPAMSRLTAPAQPQQSYQEEGGQEQQQNFQQQPQQSYQEPQQNFQQQQQKSYQDNGGGYQDNGGGYQDNGGGYQEDGGGYQEDGGQGEQQMSGADISSADGDTENSGAANFEKKAGSNVAKKKGKGGFFKKIKRVAGKVAKVVLGPLDKITKKIVRDEIKKDGGVIKPDLRSRCVSKVQAAAALAAIPAPGAIVGKIIDRAISQLSKDYSQDNGDEGKGGGIDKRILIGGAAAVALILYMGRNKGKRNA